MIGAAVGAEKEIHQWRKIGVISEITILIMVPVMQFRGTYQNAQWPDGQPHIGMNINRPQTAKCDEPGHNFQRKAEQQSGQVDDRNRVNRIKRMLAMGSQPIKMFCAVMDRMKTPKERDFVLEAVRPVDAEIGKDNHFNALNPNWLSRNILAKRSGHRRIQPITGVTNTGKNEACPK